MNAWLVYIGLALAIVAYPAVTGLDYVQHWKILGLQALCFIQGFAGAWILNKKMRN